MTERWRKRTLLILSVIINWCTHMENSKEVSLKTKNRATIWSYNPTPGHISRENDNLKRYIYPSVHSRLFTIAKTEKQPKCPSTNEWMKMWWVYTHTHTHTHTHTQWNISQPKKKKKWHNANCSIIALSEIIIKWSKSEEDKYHTISLICGV